MVAPPAVPAATVEAALSRSPSQEAMPAAVPAAPAVPVAPAMEVLVVTAVRRRRQTMPMLVMAAPAERRHPEPEVPAARVVRRRRRRPQRAATLPPPVTAVMAAPPSPAMVAPVVPAECRRLMPFRPGAGTGGQAAAAEAPVESLAREATLSAPPGLFAAARAGSVVRAVPAKVAPAVRAAMAPRKPP
jgi:hypothetical protein